LKSASENVSALLAEHGGRLFALLYRLTLRSDVAEDLLQELFCKLAQSDGFHRADNRLAFAYRVATNLAFDWRRANKRHPTMEADCNLAAAPIGSPLADLVRREELEQTLNAISELSVSGREIIVLRYLEQQSYEIIAKQLGKTTHQVRAIAHKAIKQLRGLLNADPASVSRVQAIGEESK
jgi:RNA polymerase sigma-70 factor (ECF subfamily)